MQLEQAPNPRVYADITSVGGAGKIVYGASAHVFQKMLHPTKLAVANVNCLTHGCGK